MSGFLALLILAVIIMWYLFASIRSFRKYGFDPSLITTVSPLNSYRHKAVWLMLGLALISSLLYRNSSLPLLVTAGLALGFALTQVFLLIIFNRWATQPILSYCLTGALGLLVLHNKSVVYRLLVIAALYCLQIYALWSWRKNQDETYNKWVENQVHAIHKKYSKVSHGLSDEEWFYTLHIAVTENIARPKFTRIGESIYFHLKHPERISSGIMQVSADKLLSDLESVERGSALVKKALDSMPNYMVDPIDKLKWMAHQYNGSVSEKANADYVGYLSSTYPGLKSAWEKIINSSNASYPDSQT